MKVNGIIFFTLLSNFLILRVYIVNSKHITASTGSRMFSMLNLQENELPSKQYRGVFKTPSNIYDANFCKISELNSSKALTFLANVSS